MNIFLIFGAIAVAMALGQVLAPKGGGAQSVAVTRTTTALNSQTQTVRVAIERCVASGIQSAADPYPAVPGSGLVQDLVCPYTGASLWGGQYGAFLPAPPSGFGAWRYERSGVGPSLEVSVYTDATAASLKDPGLKAAVRQIPARYGSGGVAGSLAEVTATMVGGTLRYRAYVVRPL